LIEAKNRNDGRFFKQNVMTKTLYTIAVLCICHTTSSCVSRKKIAQNGGDQIHNVTTRFEEKFKADFPGSAMIERIDSSGQNSIYSIKGLSPICLQYGMTETRTSINWHHQSRNT